MKKTAQENGYDSAEAMLQKEVGAGVTMDDYLYYLERYYLGYQYFDWNVSSGDAGETTDTDTVAENIINGCAGRKASVVLQHDIKDYSVDAVEQVLIWGINNGYVFRALDVSSPNAHHGINN